MLDLRDPKLFNQQQSSNGKDGIEGLLNDEQLKNKRLAKELEEKSEAEVNDIRRRNKTSFVESKSEDNSMFDFLLKKEYVELFMKYLELYHTRAEPNNPKSKTMMLSQKRFLDYVKQMKPTEERLQKSSQSAFYKWLCRNGFGTNEQITKYYKSRSKENASQLKRRVIIEELVNDLADRPELVDKLFENKYFVDKIKRVIQG